ncbi:dolichyl-phosphate-mannose-proteinmannosyltransferase [Rhizoctonia solani AG-1 IB]|nr:dolichyl-phosphate-mannose-proteinmannosyltransferase [Rhizoctonia solani AG-1 IB]
MSDAASGTRRRGYGRGATEHGSIATASVIDDDDHPRRDMMGLWNPNGERERATNAPFESESTSLAVMGALTALAFLLRFYKINQPDQVVFDEVHFGKFAAYYILREYYFDVHPPFAKMLLAAAGWFSGFDGKFEFDNIGDSYTEHHVPYVGIRALPAVLGSLTVPIVFQIMKESGYPTIVSAFAASLILFDNGHVTQSRLILLDAQLCFFMALSLYSYIRFRKLRYA